MPETCEICGTTENIQEHHISYEPEIKQFLCVTCHQKKHGHGVGKAKGWTTKLSELLRIDAKMLFKEGATNGEVAKACDICYATASHWRKKLGLGLPRCIKKLKISKIRQKGKGRSYYVPISDSVRQELFTMADDENKNRKKGEKQITDITVIKRILWDWYKKRMGAKH